jgi:hypothetical protein
LKTPNRGVYMSKKKEEKKPEAKKEEKKPEKKK